jgi:hypothetical protein
VSGRTCSLRRLFRRAAVFAGGFAGRSRSEIVPVARLTYERNLLTAARLEFEPNEPGGTE